jgi:NAD(P)H-nitrite reductase large subunit
MTPEEEEAKRLAIVKSFRVVCICNKIKRGIIEKAIDSGATTITEVRMRTRAATGPCGAKRCGPVITRMLRGED